MSSIVGVRDCTSWPRMYGQGRWFTILGRDYENGVNWISSLGYVVSRPLVTHDTWSPADLAVFTMNGAYRAANLLSFVFHANLTVLGMSAASCLPSGRYTCREVNANQ